MLRPPADIPLHALEYRYLEGDDADEHLVNEWPDSYFSYDSKWKKIER